MQVEISRKRLGVREVVESDGGQGRWGMATLHFMRCGRPILKGKRCSLFYLPSFFSFLSFGAVTEDEEMGQRIRLPPKSDSEVFFLCGFFPTVYVLVRVFHMGVRLPSS